MGCREGVRTLVIWNYLGVEFGGGGPNFGHLGWKCRRKVGGGGRGRDEGDRSERGSIKKFSGGGVGCLHTYTHITDWISLAMLKSSRSTKNETSIDR